APLPHSCPLWNTGVGTDGQPLAEGTPDPHFILGQHPASSGTTAVAVPAYELWNEVPIGGVSSWIGTSTNLADQPGAYCFTNHFENCCASGTSSIVGFWEADNSVDLYIDGVLLASRPGGAPQNFQVWADFSVSGLSPGNHTAVFVVTNAHASVG